MPKNTTRTLMIQGTTSDAGKSTLVAGLCRLFAQKHFSVAPFKPQNMALNSAVTPCGGEIGRAQAFQAKAAGIELSVDFNPILLKPNSDTGAQVIVHGKALTNMEANEYQDYKKVAMQAVIDSHQRLSKKHQLIIVEGAGSPAEINLRSGDIANMGFAEAVNCPVIIVADIDRGGVFAHIVGTLMLLSQSEQERVIGFVINRFRGDIKLLESGLSWLEKKTKKPVLGVLPYLHGIDISSEDAIITQQERACQKTVNSSSKVKVVVLVYPHMSNHTDFDALRHHTEIDCLFLFTRGGQSSTSIPFCDLIILPGSKNVRADLNFVRTQGWHTDIAKHLRYGGKVFGVCGGYQMLGLSIADKQGIEGLPGTSKGLGYFPFRTVLKAKKTVKNVSGKLMLRGKKVNFIGYEIHAGVSEFIHSVKKANNEISSLLAIDSKPYGAITQDEQIAGCYVHGLFDAPQVLTLFSSWLGKDISAKVSIEQLEQRAINRVGDACQSHLDINKIEDLLQQWYLKLP